MSSQTQLSQKEKREAMVSFQSSFPELNQINTVSEPENNSKKRKSDHDSIHAQEILPYKHWKHYNSISKPTISFDLQLDTPLPSQWQRCLDIQSGEIHFYNSTTNKRTLRDPRATSPEPPSHHMSLDLELNLPCGSPTSEKAKPAAKSDKDKEIEMVATVCVRCHMLVMLCKSSPTCPNCKFLNPPYKTSTDLFNPRLSLSC